MPAPGEGRQYGRIYNKKKGVATAVATLFFASREMLLSVTEKKVKNYRL